MTIDASHAVCYKDVVQRFERFAAVISQYSPGRTILEIGSGDGELASILMKSGYVYTGIDRQPRVDLPNIIAVDFSEYETDQRFDCVATQYVLHHVPDIEVFVKRMLRFLKAGGILAIGEYGWERSEDPAFREERADLHTSETMIRKLDQMLRRIHYEDVPYKDGDDALGFVWLGRRRTE